MKILFEWISIDGQLFLCARIVRKFTMGAGILIVNLPIKFKMN